MVIAWPIQIQCLLFCNYFTLLFVLSINTHKSNSCNLIMDNYITCSGCSKIYCSVKNYNNHIERNRCKPTGSGFSCQYCSKVFTRNYNKSNHEVKCDKNPLLIIEELKIKASKI